MEYQESEEEIWKILNFVSVQKLFLERIKLKSYHR